MEINTEEDCIKAGLLYGYPYILKKRRLAYDGNGNFVVNSEEQITEGCNKLGGSELYAERWVSYTKEIAMMIVKSENGVVAYPVVETIQDNNICHIVIAPAQISRAAEEEANYIACNAVSSLSGYGIFGVELFLLIDDSILLNEIAPR